MIETPKITRFPQQDQSAIEATFHTLAENWYQETGMYSSLAKKIQHPLYRQIVDLGVEVVPLMLKDLQSTPRYWFPALKELTGENPAVTEQAVDIPSVSNAWITWGKLKGLI